MREKVTTAFVLDKRSKNPEKTYPLKLRVTYKRQPRLYGVEGIRLTEKDYAKLFSRIPGDLKSLKIKLSNLMSDVEDMIDTLPNFSFDEFKRLYFDENSKEQNSVKRAFNMKSDELIRSDKLSTANTYQDTLKKIIEFDSVIEMERIDVRWLKDFESWMVKQGFEYASIGIYMRNLRHIVNRSIERGTKMPYPFGTSKKGKYQIPVSKKKNKALSMDQLKELFAFQTDDRKEREAILYFKFSYLANGINIADMANIKLDEITGDEYSFLREKTKDTVKVKREIQIILDEELLEIVNYFKGSNDYYLFPIYDKNMDSKRRFYRKKRVTRIINSNLKQVALKIGLPDKISMYWARHTYSNVLMNSEVSLEYIRESLGHVNLSTTMQYLNSVSTEKSLEYRKHLKKYKE